MGCGDADADADAKDMRCSSATDDAPHPTNCVLLSEIAQVREYNNRCSREIVDLIVTHLPADDVHRVASMLVTRLDSECSSAKGQLQTLLEKWRIAERCTTQLRADIASAERTFVEAGEKHAAVHSQLKEKRAGLDAMQCCAEAAGVAAKQLRVAVARQERETSDMENRAREMTRKQRQALSEAVSAEKKTRAAESAAERWRTSHAAAESENRSLQKRITAQQERSSSLRRTLSERNAATVQERFESLLREWDALLLTDAYLSEHGSVRASRSSSSLAGLEVAVRSRCVARALTHLRNLDGTLLACEKARDETAGRERELSVVRAQRAAAERELDQAKRQRALVEREVQHHTRVVYRLNEQALPALRDLAQQAARQATLAESMCLSLAESNQDRLME